MGQWRRDQVPGRLPRLPARRNRGQRSDRDELQGQSHGGESLPEPEAARSLDGRLRAACRVSGPSLVHL